MLPSPIFRTPFTDLTGTILNHQFGGQCGEIEMKTMDCLEAYGLDRGEKKCHLLLKDFEECSTKLVQTKRLYAMHKEIRRQQAAGEHKYKPTPPLDSY